MNRSLILLVLKVLMISALGPCFAQGNLPSAKRPFLDFDVFQNQDVSGTEEGKRVVYEVAAFRVESSTFFLSDLQEYIRVLKVAKCLAFPFFVLESIGIEKMPKAIPGKNPNTGQIRRYLADHSDFFHKLIKLIKLETFVVEQKSVASIEFVKQLSLEKCKVGMRKKRWPPRLENFFKMEGYLRDRFNSVSVKPFFSSLETRLTHDVFF